MRMSLKVNIRSIASINSTINVRHVTLTGDKHEQVMWSLRMTIWLYFCSITLSCLTLDSFMWCTASSTGNTVFLRLQGHISQYLSLFSKFFTQRAQHQSMWAKLWIIYHCFGTKCIHWQHQITSFITLTLTPPKRYVLYKPICTFTYCFQNC